MAFRQTWDYSSLANRGNLPMTGEDGPRLAGSSVPWDRRPDGGGHDHGGPGQSPCRRPRLAPGQGHTPRIARSHAPSGGKSTLGFRTPSGSRARLRARNVEIALALRERYSHRLLE